MIDYRRYTLPDGLRVIHNFDPSTSVVAVDVLYNTGARDERRSLTGIAHLFEHLMFGGSVNVPDFDLELSDAGGESNAWTSNDFTNFYEVLPAANIETALHLESDRMLRLSFSEDALNVQRSVVIEEFKQQCLNRPYGDLMHGLRSMVYAPEHPYSWPVIGIEPSHIAAVTNDDVRAWFHSHYAPNNAVLAIAGNLPYDEGRRLVEKWWADVPARDIAPRSLPAPGFPTETVRKTMYGDVPNAMLVIAFPMAGYGDRSYFVDDCITDLLSAGRSSRIFRNIVADGDGSIIEADASIVGSEGPGMLMMTARVADTSALAAAEDALMKQLALLAEPGNVTPHELERTFNRFESTFSFSLYDAGSKAAALALAEMHGEDINANVARQRTITVDEIAAEAHRLLTSPRAVLHYLPTSDHVD